MSSTAARTIEFAIENNVSILPYTDVVASPAVQRAMLQLIGDGTLGGTPIEPVEILVGTNQEPQDIAPLPAAATTPVTGNRRTRRAAARRR